MPECPLNGDDVAALGDESRGVEVPEVMEREFTYSGGFADLPPAVGCRVAIEGMVAGPIATLLTLAETAERLRKSRLSCAG